MTANQENQNAFHYKKTHWQNDVDKCCCDEKLKFGLQRRRNGNEKW